MEEENFKTPRIEGIDVGGEEVDNVSDQQLKFGYWILTNKKNIILAVIIGLLVFIVVTFAYTIYSLINYYLVDQSEYQEKISTSSENLVDIEAVHRASEAVDLQVVTKQVISLGNNKVDLVAKVKNPNIKWALQSLTYQFSLGGDFFPEAKAYFLPGEEKYLMTLNVQGAAGSSVQIYIKDLEWERAVGYDQLAMSRINFPVSDVDFIPARSSEVSDELPVSRTTAIIKNMTAYNYKNFNVQIALFSGSRLVGITQLPYQRFYSGDIIELNALWTQNLPTITKTEITTSVNILDDNVYKAYEGTFDPGILDIKN